MRNTLDRAGLQWLEADVEVCPKGIFALDSVRVADWSPDIHYSLQDVDDREIIMRPAPGIPMSTEIRAVGAQPPPYTRMGYR